MTGARIIFPSEKDKDREVITILGTKESVAQAKKELESKIKDLVSQLSCNLKMRIPLCYKLSDKFYQENGKLIIK